MERKVVTDFRNVKGIMEKDYLDNVVTYPFDIRFIKRNRKYYYVDEANGIISENLYVLDENEIDNENGCIFTRVPNNITEFETGNLVIVRNYNDEIWRLNIFSHYTNNNIRKYGCISGDFAQCLLYDINKEFIGTTEIIHIQTRI